MELECPLGGRGGLADPGSALLLSCCPGGDLNPGLILPLCPRSPLSLFSSCLWGPTRGRVGGDRAQHGGSGAWLTLGST